jgi:enterochelin esterase-like enzyme
MTPSGWAYVTYPLSDFTGKEITIDFSCEMKLDNPDGVKFDDEGVEATGYKLKWQINDGSSYPEVVTHVFTAAETDWVKVEGKNATPVKISSGNVLYLSTNNETPNIKVSVRNIKYTVTYGGKEEKKPEAKVYPTDIFKVGDAGSCGITLGDTKEAFTVFTDGSAAANIQTETDGSVTWIATAAGGGGGGVAFYVKASKEEIQIANYESIDIEMVYSPVTGAWNPEAQKPGFCMRVLPWDSTGMFGGYEDLEYFDAAEEYGTLTKTLTIPATFADKIKKSSDFDAILGFAIKFNDYNRGNTDGDQLKVQLKSVKFNKKANAVADKAFDDGLTAAQRGTVKSIEYPTRDWSIEDATKVTDADKYNKHAWVYLPAGYDAADKNTKYPVFILLHGFGQNENTWGLSDKGRGGKIKGYMDRGMAKGDVKKFILVCVTGVADKTWGPNGSGNSFTGYNCFGGELRNDLLPYLRKTYNIADGRDNVAIAGLSMGGGQTFNIGIGQCLDLISNFAGFSGALFTQPEAFKNEVKEKFDSSLKIQNLYMICGDNDSTVYFGNKEMGTPSYTEYVNALKDWDRVENFESYVYPGGTHDFPVWYYGFNDFIHMVFQTGVQLYE